ncbi:cyclic nucleotide-binding domain-containing protein, partial [Arthrospira platensis SPKY1]|nr:cyclic nucleotide-binding domain-containing protein [Arthrospira platensis SPKY1]
MKNKTNDMAALLQQCSLFSELDSEKLQLLAARSEYRSLGGYATIYERGQAADHLYILVKGGVKISGQLNSEREVIKQILYPIGVFGELCLT